MDGRNSYLREFTTRQAIIASVLAYVFLILTQVIAILVGQGIVGIGAHDAIGSVVSSILYIGLALACVIFICKKILKVSLPECRISKFSVKSIWVVAAAALPLVVTVCFLLMAGEWQNTAMDGDEICYTIIDAVVFYGIAAGFIEEMIFRGVLMTALERRWNKYVAVIIPSFIFAVSHVLGADLDFLSILQLLLAGTVVGVMFCLITYESKSIWNSALVHCVWNIIIIGGILHIGVEAKNVFWLNYVLDSHSFLVTGGDFGIEASMTALAGYVSVSVLALLLMKRNKNK